MKRIPLDESIFEGAVSFEKQNGELRPWRVPFDQRALFTPDILLEKARTGAGIRLRFQTESEKISLHLAPVVAPARFDLTLGGELVQSVSLDTDEEQADFNELPPGPKTIELWLPQSMPVSIRGLEVDEDASVAVPEDPRPLWVTYGSSITHCSSAHSPARTWPATAARARHLNLTCLGFGGNCHLEPMIARMIRDLPADFISVKCGINIMGGASLGPRTFKAAVIGFIKILREKHTDIPIAVVSPIISPPRETTPNAVGLSLTAMREEISDAVARLRDCGDANLHYFDGLQLFGADLVTDYLPDQLHPNGPGYEVLGQRFVEQVLVPLGIGCSD